MFCPVYNSLTVQNRYLKHRSFHFKDLSVLGLGHLCVEPESESASDDLDRMNRRIMSLYWITVDMSCFTIDKRTNIIFKLFACSTTWGHLKHVTWMTTICINGKMFDTCHRKAKSLFKYKTITKLSFRVPQDVYYMSLYFTI